MRKDKLSKMFVKIKNVNNLCREVVTKFINAVMSVEEFVARRSVCLVYMKIVY